MHGLPLDYNRLIGVPAIYVAFAMNNRREGVKEGRKALEYPQAGKFGR